jgi:hypothetical protein
VTQFNLYCSGYAEVLKPEDGGGERATEPPELLSEEEEEAGQEGGQPVPHILHTGYTTALHQLNGTEEQEERISTLTSTLDHMKDRLHSLQEVLKEKDLTDERLVCDERRWRCNALIFSFVLCERKSK